MLEDSPAAPANAWWRGPGPALTANARAIRTYEAVGFRPVGVMRRYERGADGNWHEGLLMDLLRES